MKYGHAIGIDIVEIKRLERSAKKWKEAFLQKIFTAKEMQYAYSKKFPYQHLAGRFAAKEAIFKALGEVEKEFVGWKNVEILNEPTGKPYVCLHGSAKKLISKKLIKKVLISISHSEHYAVANAVLVY